MLLHGVGIGEFGAERRWAARVETASIAAKADQPRNVKVTLVTLLKSLPLKGSTCRQS